MLLYYAFGDGLGHLTRANALLNTLGYQTDDFLILTSSDYFNVVFNKENVIKLPEALSSRPEEIVSEIDKIVFEYKIDNLFIDSFPAGLNGELCDLRLKHCKINYVARLLNWDNYECFLNEFKLKFETVYIVEDLPAQQLDFIVNHSNNYRFIQLKYPNPVNFLGVNQILQRIDRPVWLVVHTGSFNELQQLMSYAYDLADLENIMPGYLIISQIVGDLELKSGFHLKYYPASDFFPFVDKIFTACGYNSIAQTAQFIDKHYFIPFARKFDDQFARSKNRKLLINSTRFR